MSITTNEKFRQAFPAFMDPGCYPDYMVDIWMKLAAKLHDAARWGELLEFGVHLFVAHNLALEFGVTQGVLRGQTPGQILGPVTSGSVDKVSYSREINSLMEPGAGHWNATIYGLRYIRLVRMVGAGPVQVGADPSMTNEPIASMTAWPGVIPPPFG